MSSTPCFVDPVRVDTYLRSFVSDGLRDCCSEPGIPTTLPGILAFGIAAGCRLLPLPFGRQVEYSNRDAYSANGKTL